MQGAMFSVVGLGGTFDHFHKGHERFLLFAAGLARHMQIGITKQDRIRGKLLSYLCQGYEERARSVAEFCKKHDLSYEIIPLYDIYGPTLEGSLVDVLCVTKETMPGAEAINKARKECGLDQLPVYTCDYYLDELGAPLHSVAIRAGLVNREGRVYGQIFQSTLIVSKKQREFFAKPQGRVAGEVAPGLKENVFVVGDATLEYFITRGLPYQFGVYDKKRNRAVVSSAVIDALQPDIEVENAPGSISLELVRALESALQKKARHMFVEGEEDLAAVALVLLVPLESLVYYGQSGKGMVEIHVNEETKDRFYDVLNSDSMKGL